MVFSLQSQRGRQKIASAGLVVLAAAVIVGFLRSALSPDSPTVISTRCENVTIHSGTKGLASWRYGEVVKNLLEGAARSVSLARPVRVVMDENSDGSIYNINKLAEGDLNPDCRLGFAAMNVAVDAVEGFDVFRGQPVPGLRAVGPLIFDVLHIIVRRDSPVRDAANLCGHAVSTYKGSGASQLLRLLARLSGNPNCEIRISEKYEGLDGLDHPWDPSDPESAAAVVWSSAGVPNKTLREKAEKTDIRLLPVEDFKRIFQDDWERAYGTLPDRGRKYYSGRVFEDVVIEEGYYRDVPRMSAFGVPSGLVVRADADAGLVRFLTQALFEERAAFQRALWGEDVMVRNERSFPDPELVSQNPLFCYAQPHAAAEEFYRQEATEGGYTYQGQCGGGGG